MPSIHTRSLLKVGGSLALTVPRPWVLYWGLAPGDRVEVVADGELQVRPLNRRTLAPPVKDLRRWVTAQGRGPHHTIEIIAG